jgi:hypothetical protein
MFKRKSSKRIKQSQASRLVVYLFWLISVVAALIGGWIVAENFHYASQSQVLSAEVINKSSYRSRTNNSRYYSTSYTVTYQFENPNVKDKFDLESELAPLVYPLVEKGELIEIYYNEFAKPQSKIRMLHHYWLNVLIWMIIFYFIYLITRSLTNSNPELSDRLVKFKQLLAVSFFAPVVLNFIYLSSNSKSTQQEVAMQQNWPSWPALESAVPKPTWWDQVAIKYFDPMNYTSEEYSAYLKANIGDDKRHRQFKVAYVFLLKHQDDPLQMGWDLAKGTTREFIPLYKFFLEQFMHTEWRGNCSRPCNDATQMVEMAGDLLSMTLDENQIDYSELLIADIMKYKYQRANNRGKYYFLHSYRRLLEHTESKEKAHQVLDELVTDCLQEAENTGDQSMVRKWENFWSSSQRKVGMFSRS